MAANRPINATAGFSGTGQSGKTTLAYLLGLAAGVDPDIVIRETSARIVPLAELFRCWLLKLIAAGCDLTDEFTAPWIALAFVLPWLKEVTDGELDLPPDALNLECTDDTARQLLLSAMAAVQNNPADYQEPVTIYNKSTKLYRRLLSGINVILNQIACAWLTATTGEQVTNIWPWMAANALRQLLASEPDLPLVGISGLRMPGDDAYILQFENAIIFERQRKPPEKSEDLLYTEQYHITPHFIVVGDTSLEELEAWIRDVLWPAIRDGLLAIAGPPRAIEIHVGQPIPKLALAA
jgi:hypothetical protein